MRLLYLYRYAILGGVVAQLRHRLEALRRGMEVHFGFLEDHGGTAAFGDHPHLHLLGSPQGVTDLLRETDFQVLAVIDTPEVYPAIERAETDAVVLNEVHTTYRNLDYLTELRADPPMDALITPSAYLRDRVLQEFGYAGIRPVHVVPNCLDIDLFDFREAAAAPGRRVALWVGKLDEHKNWRDFLTLAAQIAGDRDDCEFWMVGGETAGDETAREMLRVAGRLRLLERLRWIQRVDYEAMPALYSLAAQSGGALVSTSTDESFGMSVVEAMACRCPVVAARVGALPEILDGSLEVSLYPLHDLQAAGNTLRRLLDGPDLRRQIVEEGRERVRRRYSHRMIGQQYLELVRELVERSLRQRPAPVAMAEPTEDERERAEEFWADYPLKEFYFSGKEWVRRSRWLAEEILSKYEFASLLEPGCNCGRNLFYALERHPGVEAAGFDVNEQAIAFAREHVPGAAFEVRSVHKMADIPDDRYDLIFTMSLLDHVPQVEGICRELLRIARKAVILIEVDTGAQGKCVEHLKQKGVDNYCYSRNYARLFESLGAKVRRYDPIPEQFPETFMGANYRLLEVTLGD